MSQAKTHILGSLGLPNPPPQSPYLGLSPKAFLVSRLSLHEAFQFLVSTKTKGGAKRKLFSHQNETKDFLKMDMDSNHEVCTRLLTGENTKTTLRTDENDNHLRKSNIAYPILKNSVREQSQKVNETKQSTKPSKVAKRAAKNLKKNVRFQ